jgi:hypothetical protein
MESGLATNMIEGFRKSPDDPMPLRASAFNISFLLQLLRFPERRRGPQGSADLMLSFPVIVLESFTRTNPHETACG